MTRRESQGWGAGERDGEQKSSDGQKDRNTENEKNTYREHNRDRIREKNQEGEGQVTGPRGSEREGTQSKAEEWRKKNGDRKKSRVTKRKKRTRKGTGQR